MKSRKTSIVLALVLLCSPLVALAQQTSAPAVTDPIGRFLGTWELHMKKEGPAVPDRETLTIERTEGGIKITELVEYDRTDPGSALHFWGVMDPKGSFIRMRDMDGKPINDEWRIVGVVQDAIIIETRPIPSKRKYQLSGDGQIMKMIRLPLAVKFPVSLPDLTFQKSN